MIENHVLLHVKVSSGVLDDFVHEVEQSIATKQKKYCIPLNVTKYVVAKTDARLCSCIEAADMVIADGKPITWLARACGYTNVQHITGIDFADKLMYYAAQKRWRIFLLGAQPGILERTVRYLEKKYDGLVIAGGQDGYFKDTEVKQVIESINSSTCDIVLVALGMPQKEYFIDAYRGEIVAPFMLPVGGAFDVWAGQKKRAPLWISSCGLEWLYRTLYDVKKCIVIMKHGCSFLKDLIVAQMRNR